MINLKKSKKQSINYKLYLFIESAPFQLIFQIYEFITLTLIALIVGTGPKGFISYSIITANFIILTMFILNIIDSKYKLYKNNKSLREIIVRIYWIIFIPIIIWFIWDSLHFLKKLFYS